MLTCVPSLDNLDVFNGELGDKRAFRFFMSSLLDLSFDPFQPALLSILFLLLRLQEIL